MNSIRISVQLWRFQLRHLGHNIFSSRAGSLLLCYILALHLGRCIRPQRFHPQRRLLPLHLRSYNLDILDSSIRQRRHLPSRWLERSTEDAPKTPSRHPARPRIVVRSESRWTRNEPIWKRHPINGYSVA